MANLNLIFTGSNADIDWLVENASTYLGYQEEIDGETNPETRVQFIKRWYKERLMEFARTRDRARELDDIIENETPRDIT